MSDGARVRTEVVGDLYTNCYFLSCGDDLLVIDPGGDPEKLISVIRDIDPVSVKLIATHCHFDHILAARDIQDAFRCVFMIHRDEEKYMSASAELAEEMFGVQMELPDSTFIKGGGIPLGESEINVIETPGHTPGSICLSIGSKMFTGDTLFRDSIGRTDFFGSMESMRRSLHMLFSIETDCEIYPGHGDSSTLFREKKQNLLFREFSEV